VNLVVVLIISAMIIVVWSSKSVAAVVGVLGILGTGLILRSGINVTAEGLTVHGLFHTTHLAWAEMDGFEVVGYGGTGRAVLRSPVEYISPNQAAPQVVGLPLEAIEEQAVLARVPMFSVVTAVTTDGRRFRVHGTASTPLDPDFPAHAAAELNRRLRQHHPTTTAG
jgi:hypothetical protein